MRSCFLPSEKIHENMFGAHTYIYIYVNIGMIYPPFFVGGGCTTANSLHMARPFWSWRRLFWEAKDMFLGI